MRAVTRYVLKALYWQGRLAASAAVHREGETACTDKQFPISGSFPETIGTFALGTHTRASRHGSPFDTWESRALPLIPTLAMWSKLRTGWTNRLSGFYRLTQRSRRVGRRGSVITWEKMDACLAEGARSFHQAAGLGVKKSISNQRPAPVDPVLGSGRATLVFRSVQGDRG